MIERKFFRYFEKEEEEEEEGEVENKSFNFRILTYNILAQGLINRRKRHKYLSKQQARFKVRRKMIIGEIVTHKADINCFQEMDHYNDFWKKELEKNGYDSIFTENWEIDTENKKCPWGLCISFLRSKFELVESMKINFNELKNDRDNSVLENYELSISHHKSIIAVLKCKGEGLERDQYVIVSTVHLFWRPTFGWTRMRHLIKLQEEMNRLMTKYGRENTVATVAGDFNISPNDLPYILFTRQRDMNLVKNSEYFNFPEYAKDFHDVMTKEAEPFEELVKKREISMMRKLEFFNTIVPLWKSVYGRYTLIDKEFEKDERYFDEPKFTHYVPDYRSTLDYIMLVNPEKCKILRILELPKITFPIPNGPFASDHLCLSSDLKILM